MKRLLFVFLQMAACVVGLGLYRGWIRVESGSTSDRGQIKLTVDKDKIHQDQKKVEAKVQNLEHQVTDK